MVPSCAAPTRETAVPCAQDAPASAPKAQVPRNSSEFRQRDSHARQPPPPQPEAAFPRELSQPACPVSNPVPPPPPPPHPASTAQGDPRGHGQLGPFLLSSR